MDQISLSQDKKYVSKRGVEFEIEKLPNSLHQIKMKRGGHLPSICKNLYTSYSQAEKSLISYLTRKDVLKLAQYPGK